VQQRRVSQHVPLLLGHAYDAIPSMCHCCLVMHTMQFQACATAAWSCIRCNSQHVPLLLGHAYDAIHIHHCLRSGFVHDGKSGSFLGLLSILLPLVN
jgi:hypothetical protein